ncbi:MAG: hypothetical protein IJU72_10280 [Bacteroidales bacterium]|nr:hypothetical protein [Bacteroidales bacterium]
MIKRFATAVCVIVAVSGSAQMRTSISAMRWGADYKLHVRMANDSAYVLDVKGLYHSGGDLFADTNSRSTTYYPVTLDPDFVAHIKRTNLAVPDTAPQAATSDKTLWSAIHARIGGGYVHFVNCLVYTIEAHPALLSAPIFVRPATKWKPKPMTQSYKRTRGWQYYFPSTQKQAKREYKCRLKENDLADLHGVPQRFIDLFMSTSQRAYDLMRQQGRANQVAQIDLVRLLLGAKYLGEPQIRSISNGVAEAVMRYSSSTMPSIIIFDDYHAAVAMSLGRDGYQIDRIVYADAEQASHHELESRTEMIEQLIRTINQANEQVFQKRLRQYYQHRD